MTLLLHSIGDKDNSNYNTREEIKNSDDVLTFDGVYRNVYENKDVLVGKKILFFVIGNHIGGDNSFDHPMPLERFCEWNELEEMKQDFNAEIGWHTWSHKDLTTLSYDEIVKEITPPFPMKKLSYPYGRFNEDVLRAVREVGFDEAFSVTDGDNSQYQRLRKYL